MLKLTAGEREHLLPSSWDEAGPEAWQLLRDLVRYPVGEGKARALKRLTGLRWWQWRLLDESQLMTLNEGTPWLAIIPHAEPFRDRVRVGFGYLYMPRPNFENGSGIGYTLADEYFDQWVETGETDDALLLLATLMCHHKNGERVPPRSREQVERRAKRLRSLGPEWTAQALMYWMATREYVHEMYGSWLFQKAEDDESGRAPQGFSLGCGACGWTSPKMVCSVQ